MSRAVLQSKPCVEKGRWPSCSPMPVKGTVQTVQWDVGVEGRSCMARCRGSLETLGQIIVLSDSPPHLQNGMRVGSTERVHGRGEADDHRPLLTN